MDGLAFDDMDEFARELDDPFAELLQDVVHGLLEVYGSNPDALTRGAGLVAALSGPANLIPAIKAQIEAQLHDDSRVLSATCAITKDPSARDAYRIDIVLLVNGDELELGLLVDAVGGVKRTA